MRKDSFGLTLVEMLLALTIFSVIAASLYGTFAGGLSLNRRSHERNRLDTEARWTLAQISADIRNAVNYNFSNSYPQRRAFEGTRDSLIFIKPEKNHLCVVHYNLRLPERAWIHRTRVGGRIQTMETIIANYTEDYKRKVVVRECIPFKKFLNDKTAEGEFVILSPNLSPDGLQFHFAGRKRGSKKLEWMDKWDKPYLPVAVRVALIFISPDTKDSLILEEDIYLPLSQFSGILQ